MGFLRHTFRMLKSKILLGIFMGMALTVLGYQAGEYSSTDDFCASCHVHPHATDTWKRSTHHDNPSGTLVHCVDCHLPPGGFAYYEEKARLGIHDLYGKLFKDEAEFDWEHKSQLDQAVHYISKASCLHCHATLFPLGLSAKGKEAHLHYDRHRDELRCINCHLHVGHYSEHQGQDASFGQTAVADLELFSSPTQVTAFEDFTEQIPGSTVSFAMQAIPGGSFSLGSPASEPLREEDEGPQVEVKISPFWMGRCEVSWNEFEAFYRETASEGRTDTQALAGSKPPPGVDAVSGATPPYGTPDQGWGRGQRPAITMTHHAAMTYCRWLSLKTGKTYRLPTEAEWEYACRGGSEEAYYFGGDPEDYQADSWWSRLFGGDREALDSHAVHADNSQGRTQPPSSVQANPFGLLNMCGNVWEFCLDRYAPDQYARGNQIDPRGPREGEEYVIRGGSFKSAAGDLRSANRNHTRHDAWLLTDPQIPKSIWWYSDCIDVGFRVVCEYENQN